MFEFALFFFVLGMGVGWILSEHARIDRDFWQEYALRLEKIAGSYFRIINNRNSHKPFGKVSSEMPFADTVANL
ncbi:MAG: hypothetical protein JNN25_15390 [Candidatus Kapabacteria bacterium]|nr:hypothetical protein [Candidatus Kapabacteria bacterium]